MLLPKLRRDRERRNLYIGPPCNLIAVPMQLLMVLSAEWNGIFVAYFPSERSRLGEFEVVGVARRALADQARLR